MTNTSTQSPGDALAKCLLLSVLLSTATLSQDKNFHDAPASARTDKNPYSGQNTAEGEAAFELNCAACHGPAGEGSGNVPTLASGEAQGASDGELFWYITKGDVNNGMPAWQSLSEEQRWEIVNYHVWGRPVGVTVAHDGSLLVTDDGSKSIWRISYSGKPRLKR